MIRAPSLLIVNRSILAANIIRLLLVPWQGRVRVAKSLEEAGVLLHGTAVPDALIVDTNCFRTKFLRALDLLCDDPAVRRIPKLFMCRALPSEAKWEKTLKGLPGAHVLIRPFLPEDFREAVSQLFSRRRRSDAPTR